MFNRLHPRFSRLFYLDSTRPRVRLLVTAGLASTAQPPVNRSLPLAPRRNQHQTPSSNVVLRPYQEACIQSCLEALESGTTRIGVSAPTGSGKTTIFVTLIARLIPPSGRPRAKNALIIVNSIELAKQAAQSVRALFPDYFIEIEQGSLHKASGLADVCVTLLFIFSSQK